MDLVAVLLIGLLGSVHCVGMCGGFVFALAQTSSQRVQFLQKQASYYFGKTLTYALLGTVAGALGHMLSSAFTRIQMFLSISLGLFMILLGMSLMGVLKRSNQTFMIRPWKWVSGKMAHLLGAHSRSAPMLLGLINGFLPCGLVYAALALAATSGSAIQGGFILTVFGLSTIPALLVTALAGTVLKPVWRHRVNILSGTLIIAMGLLTVYRGLPIAHHSHSAPTHQHHMIDETSPHD